jgi:hypothetical protein
MADDELDLTEQMPKSFDSVAETPAAALPTAGPVAASEPLDWSPPADWSPAPLDTTAPTGDVELLDDSIPIELDEAADDSPRPNESVDFAIPMIDPTTLPPLPRPNMAFPRGTTATPTLSLVSRARGTVPPPLRPKTDSGAFSMPTPPPPAPAPQWNAFAQTAGLDPSAVIPQSKYQAYPVVPEARFDASNRTYAIRRTRRGMDWGKVAIAGFAALGLLIGYLAFFRDDDGARATKPTAAKPAAAAPARTQAASASASELETSPAKAPVMVATPTAKPAAAAPAPTPVELTRPAPKAAPTGELRKLHLPITSSPDGATVTLVEDGVARTIGTTPVFATLDPGHDYAVVVALKGHPSTIRHIDMKSDRDVSVDFAATRTASARSAAAATPAAASSPSVRTSAAPSSTPTPAPRASTTPPSSTPAPAPRPSPAPAPAPRTSTTTATRSSAPAPAAPASAPAKQAPPPPAQRVAAAPALQGTGTLLVSAKPPCQITIDGRPTKLTTPQHAIALSPGIHRVTLTNDQSRIFWGVDVRIAPGQSTKVIRDFTGKN